MLTECAHEYENHSHNPQTAVELMGANVNRGLLVLPIALLAMGWLTGCEATPESDAASGSGRVQIVASTDVYGDIAKQVGGGEVAVTSILTNPDQDPHSFEANPRTTLAISKADLVIENGGGYDDYMETLREAHNNSAPVLNVVEISGKKAPAGGELNEHVFYDLPSIRKFADELAAKLAALDPGHARGFTARGKAFDAKIATLVAREAALRPTLQGKSIGITEPVPLYLIEALGLNNSTPEAFSAAIEEGDDVAPRVLQNTLDLYATEKVAALVYNEQTSGAITERVLATARAAEIPVVGVTETLPFGKDYVAWMTGNIDAVGSALGAR
jgi:zinc/manganese transport system substrate-binding protein